MRYACAIFDLDGTLLNTLGDLAAAVNAALAARGLPPRSLDEVRRFVGNGVKNLITRALPAGSAEGEVEETLAAFKAYYNDHLSVHTAPYPGIVRLLKDLRAAGVKIGVNSNKYDAALQYLCREHLGGLYDMALGELEGVPKKPSPAAAERIMAALGCAPGESVYIGDSGVDIETARNAGTAAITVTWGFRSREELAADRPEVLVDSAEALGAYLLK